MTSINPYNFVPLNLKNRPDRTEWTQKPTERDKKIYMHHRLSEDTHSGHFELRLQTITPVFIPSYSRGDVVKERYRNKDGTEDERLTFNRFHRSGEDPIIPGTSIRGMIRSVFEALTNSCMALFAETYIKDKNKRHYQASNYKREECNAQNGLCSACSVFGTILGDDLSFQGKVRFSDAIGKKDDLEKEEWILKELSAPKPERHSNFYAADKSSPVLTPRGRKFYFHHDPKKVASKNYITQGEHNKRNRKILERLKAGVSLSSTMDFQGLTEKELGALLYALELEYKIVENNGNKREPLLAHKIGMGKPLGLGSVEILITGGNIEKGATRYMSFGSQAADEVSAPQDLRAQIKNFRKKAFPQEIFQLSGHLHDLLSLSKCKQGNIKYPGYHWFQCNKKKNLGTLGEFEGTITQVPEPNSDAPISATETPHGKPPSGLPSDQKTVWLKEIYEKRLVFVDTEGKKIERRINDFQAKKSLLGVGRWYVLKGTKSAWPLKKQ
jgi:hypothetical protein